MGVRGPKGGYTLSKSAKKTKLSDIIEAIDENLQITKCSGNDFGCSQKKHYSKCLTHNLWVELGDHLYSFFNSITLDDVINNNLRRTNWSRQRYQREAVLLKQSATLSPCLSR